MFDGQLEKLRWHSALEARPVKPFCEQRLIAWFNQHLQKFFPFQKFILAYAELRGGQINAAHMCEQGNDPAFINQLDLSFSPEKRGCIAHWLKSRTPFILDAETPPAFATALEISEAKSFNLGRIVGHGTFDPIAKAGTYITFAGVPKESEPKRIHQALELMAPVIHAMMLDLLCAPEPMADLATLTDRQRQIVQLAIEGLGDKEIAARLGLSEHTVGGHLRLIYKSLGIKKRFQLMELA